MSGALSETPVRRFLLNELAKRGRRRFGETRYVAPLRLMEEHGLVRYSLGAGNWSLTKRGRETLEGWQA